MRFDHQFRHILLHPDVICSAISKLRWPTNIPKRRRLGINMHEKNTLNTTCMPLNLSDLCTACSRDISPRANAKSVRVTVGSPAHRMKGCVGRGNMRGSQGRRKPGSADLRQPKIFVAASHKTGYLIGQCGASFIHWFLTRNRLPFSHAVIVLRYVVP